MEKIRFLKKPMILLSTLFIILGLAACKHDPEERMEYFAEKVSDKLEFTEQQNEIWNQIVEDVLTLRQGAVGERESKMDMLVAQIESEQLDEAQFYMALEQHQQKMTEAFQTILPQLNSLHSTLSPEQKEKLLTFIEKHKERGKHRWH